MYLIVILNARMTAYIYSFDYVSRMFLCPELIIVYNYGKTRKVGVMFTGYGTAAGNLMTPHLVVF